MTTVLGVPGRFGELTITRSDVKALQATGCGCGPTSLDRVWDKIKDWFCNTKLVEAKRHLQVLYSPYATFLQKGESYFALKALVGPAYLDRFSEEAEAFGYSLNIQFGEGLEPFREPIVLCSRTYVEKTLDEDITMIASDTRLEDLSKQELARDLPRFAYTIAGEKIEDLDPDVVGEPGKIENFRKAIVEAFDVTEEQMQVLEWICYQKTFAILMESAFRRNGGLFLPEEVIHIRGDGEISVDFTAKGSDIELHLHFSSTWLDLGVERAILMRDPAYDIRLTVGWEGNVAVLGAVVGFDPNSGEKSSALTNM